MAIDLVVSESRRGTFVLSVKGYNAGEVYQTAVRINKYLASTCPGWKPYVVPARKDLTHEGQYYCPVPITSPGTSLTPYGIDQLLVAMEKAGVMYCYTSLVSQFVLVPAPGPDLDEDAILETRYEEEQCVRAWCQEQTKAQLIEWLNGRCSANKRMSKAELTELVIAHA